MKIPIKKEFLDKIKSGEKVIEYRDAHLTFVCEETGEEFKVDVLRTFLIEKEITRKNLDIKDEEFNEMFTDEKQIAFLLR